MPMIETSASSTERRAAQPGGRVRTRRRRSRPAIVTLVAVVAFARVEPAETPAQGAPASDAGAPASSSSSAPSDPCASLSSLVSRPTFSTAVCAVKADDLLIETGYTNATTSGSGANGTVTYPQANLRVGLGGGLEFDLVPPSLARYAGTLRANGITDGAIGAKYEIGDTSKFSYGLNVLYTLASGTAPFSGFGDGILANANATYTVSPAVGLYATFGYNEQSAGTQTVPARYHDYQTSLGGSLALPPNVNVFFEGFDQSSTGVGLGGRFAIDTGIEKDLGSRVQLDANYYDYLGVQNGGHQHSVGLGAAYLIGR